jgi:hypothetical protein
MLNSLTDNYDNARMLLVVHTALQELDMHPERLCKDSALILQLLRDNLTMWEELHSPTVFLPE